MVEKKILLKGLYKELLSDAYAENNDKLLPIGAYDDEVIGKIEKLITIDAQDYEVAIDSENSKNYYETYLRIFYGIIKCENEEDLGKWKDSIIENNPWKKALENSEQFRSIADSDYKIMEALITKESEGFIKNLLDNNLFKTGIETINENDEFRKMIADELAIPFFEKLFSRFEHAFDGNFEDPRVIILGINPRLQNISHEDFGLKKIYKNIFDCKCPSYVREENHEIYKYYFRNGGFFFGALGKNKKDKEKNKIMIKLREYFMNSLEMKFPYALYEFFPYATDSENNWYKNIKINNGKEYLALEKLLPSQIWMLCLLTYTLKKAIFSGRTMYLFLTKNNEEFKKGFFDKYLELLNISSKTNIKILTKNNNQNRNFRWNNIKEYNKKKMNFNSVEDFFGEIWGIPRIEDFFEKIWGICDATSFLNEAYQELIYGISEKSLPIKTFAENYNKKYQTKEEACKRMMQDQINKCTTAGVIDGIVTSITVPNNIPKNIANVLYVQLQMIACTACMAGYDLNRTETKTFIYECLAGVAVNEILEKFGDRFATNFASKNDINSEAAVFGDSAVSKTESIANRAYKWFFENNLEFNDDTEEDIIIKAEDRLDG